MAWIEQRSATSWRVRYWNDDGTLASVAGFPNKTVAGHYAETLESDQRKGQWIDPAAGKLTVEEWVTSWLDSIDVATRTEESYRSLLTHHLIPRWGSTSLRDITGIAVSTWAKKQRAAGYAPATVSSMVKLLSLMLADAADERLIPGNPIRPRRRGRRQHATTREKIWAEPAEALAVADQAATLAGPGYGMLILTAAWTGARWGELVGLQRHNLHLDDARLVIDPHSGSLHETNAGHVVLGPPKTAESARTITLPPFLVPLLHTHLKTHDHPHVFVSTEGDLHRRSNFTRRAMRPAADGNHHLPRARIQTQPTKPGLTFHGLRHGHKTWMIADNIPEVAQSQRLGHILDDKIRAVYSHVAPEVEQRLLDRLQDRWGIALDRRPDTALDIGWRVSRHAGKPT